MKIEMSERDFATLCICAIRYCHGRQTYMPSLVQGIVKEHLSEIPDNDLTVMLNDCDFQAQFKLYGDEKIDKPGWLKWRETIEAEIERRKRENNGSNDV